MIVSDALATYQLGVVWSQAATLLSRLLDCGAPLEPGERADLQGAAQACSRVRDELLTSPERPLGRSVLRVAQPLYSKPALLDALVEAEASLRALSASLAGAERLAVSPGKLAWLVEFLSDCCILLLRDIATQSLPSMVSQGA